MNDVMEQPKGGDDALMAGQTLREATPNEEAEERNRAAELANDDPEGRSQFDRLFEATDQLDFFVCDGQAYISPGDSLAIPLESRKAEQHIRLAYFERFSKPPSSENLKKFIDIRAAQLAIRGENKPVFRRIGRIGDRHYLDLCRDGKVVEMTADGWRIITNPEGVYWSRKGTDFEALPNPVPGGDVLLLLDVTNIPLPMAKLLICWLVTAIRTGYSYVTIIIEGEAGSAKTTATQILKYTIDPSGTGYKSLTRRLPDNERDFAVAAHNSHILAWDNEDRITPTQSDRLCRASTGAGFANRTHYSMTDETEITILRPMIVTGIDGLVDRADMADRVALIKLERIPDTRRITEDELWAKVEEIRPQVLGGLLDAFCAALKNLRHVKLDRLPRMADFAKFATAAEAGLPWEQGEAMAAYQDSRENLFQQALEKDRVAVAVVQLMERIQGYGNTEWNGTAAELLEELEPPYGGEDRWPSKPSTVGIRISKALPLLRERGIGVDKIKSNDTRKLRLYFLSPENLSHLSHLSQPRATTGFEEGQVEDPTCPTRPADLSLSPGRDEDGGLREIFV